MAVELICLYLFLLELWKCYCGGLKIINIERALTFRINFMVEMIYSLIFYVGSVLVNDMQTSTLKKSHFHFFGPTGCLMFWNEWKINFPIFAMNSFWDMVAQNSWNPKKKRAMFWNGFFSSWVFFLLQFLVFEIWSFKI